MANKKKPSVRSDFLWLILGLITGVFVVIYVVFNLTVNQYIKTSASDQLGAAIERMNQAAPSQDAFSTPGEDNSQSGTLPDVSELPRNRFGTEARSFVIASDYSYVIRLNDDDQVTSLAEYIAEKQMDLTKEGIQHIETDAGIFYCTFLSITGYGTMSGNTVVLFVDVTGISNFAMSVNWLLIALLGVSGLFAACFVFLSTRRVTKPLEEISRFAERIGNNDFSINSANYKHRELFELNRNMNQAAGKLRKYDQSQKTFFQNASHELRTPLMSIQCHAEGIQYGVMETPAATKTILEEIKKLSEMVEDLLSISRLDNITADYVAAPCDMREVLSTAAEQHAAIAKNKDLTIRYDFDDQPLMYRCSEKNMLLAFSNLISNAVRYAEKEIKLTCKRTSEGILVSVLDDGPGIKEDDLPLIFDRFYKGEDGNHGIGLSIVKAVVEQLGGTIHVSNANPGARFTVLLKG